MSIPPKQIFEEIYRYHGHRCPMSTLGGRLGFAALKRVEPNSPLHATYYINTCAADGIRIVSGCRKEDGTLKIDDLGRHALWLENETGQGIFAALNQATLKLADAYRLLDHTFQKERTALPEEERERRLKEKEQAFEELLQRFRTVREEELIDFSSAIPPELLIAGDKSR